MSLLTRPGATLAYKLHGAEGPGIPRVLLIQGVGVAGSGWQPQVDELAPDHQLLTYDNRGLGQSRLEPRAALSIEQMADDARALLDAVGWESAHVVGHSMGGVIAQELALKHRRRVLSLALLCTVARGRDAVRMTPRMMWTALRTNFGTRASRRRAFLELIYPKSLLASADCPALAAQLAPLFGHDLAEQPRIALQQAMALRQHDASSKLGELSGLPTLVVSAEHDPIAPPRYGRELATRIPGAQFIVVPQASHGVPIQCAPQINRLLIELFASANAVRE